MSDNIEQQIQQLMDRERELIKKMNVALRAGANPTIISQFDFMLQECRFAQQELRVKQKSSDKDSDFDNYLSIG